ncbi:MAG TPA: DUF1801 domain-containing protein [Chloroflexota bacterium]|nr:DUF1801 domain-containing protein [Chloroflexota bacterium]
MSKQEVDAYLARQDEPKRSTLRHLRETILSVLPDAEEVISYQVPAFRIEGAVVAGFAAFTNHLSYLPFSGSVLPALEAEIARYRHTASALHFAIDRPLPKRLVKKLIDVRLGEIRERAAERAAKQVVKRAGAAPGARPTDKPKRRRG